VFGFGARNIRLAIVLLAALASACGSSASSSPTSLYADFSGSWTGTFESANFPSRTITVSVVQTTNCVDGAWITSTSDWHGAISGFATVDSLAGNISYERSASGGGQCDATAPMTVSVGPGTLHLTASAFTPVGTCTGDLPRQVVVNLHR
jgi:hypothetical protein